MVLFTFFLFYLFLVSFTFFGFIWSRKGEMPRKLNQRKILFLRDKEQNATVSIWGVSLGLLIQ